MRRRFLVEVEPNPDWPGAMLEILLRVADALGQMKTEKLLVDYGVGLESDISWFVKIAAKAAELEEPKEWVKVLKNKARSYKKIPNEEPGHGAADEV